MAVSSDFFFHDPIHDLASSAWAAAAADVAAAAAAAAASSSARALARAAAAAASSSAFAALAASAAACAAAAAPALAAASASALATAAAASSVFLFHDPIHVLASATRASMAFSSTIAAGAFSIGVSTTTLAVVKLPVVAMDTDLDTAPASLASISSILFADRMLMANPYSAAPEKASVPMALLISAMAWLSNARGTTEVDRLKRRCPRVLQSVGDGRRSFQ